MGVVPLLTAPVKCVVSAGGVRGDRSGGDRPSVVRRPGASTRPRTTSTAIACADFSIASITSVLVASGRAAIARAARPELTGVAEDVPQK
jgi:hypothetical protein